MIAYVFRRICQSLVLLLIMSMLVFLAIYQIGNPVDLLIPPNASEADHARAMKTLGLDEPLWKQYLTFLINVLQGDFGTSFVQNVSALRLIVQRMPATIELACAAMLMSIVIAIPLGVFCGLKPYSATARLLLDVSIFGTCLPTFWIGVMFVFFFSVMLGWFPSNGRGETESIWGVELSFVTANGLWHLVLPASTLAVYKLSLLLRLTQASVREAALQDHVRFARSKGILERRIISLHILKNAATPIITILGLEFGSTIAFAVVTETIFAWPGMGKLLVDSIILLDRPIVVAYLLAVVLMVTLINLAVDIVCAILDPRIRVHG